MGIFASLFGLYSCLISRVRPAHSFFEKKSILKNPPQIFTNYFLTLTKQPSKNNLRHLKESFLSDLSTRRWCQCQCFFSTFFSLETSSSERPVACTIISQDAPSRIRFIAILDCPSLSPSSLPSLRPSSRPSLSPSSLPTL
ncbi:unknown [Bacteroides sp. CAG:770]|nr:unknown [Bacteroides sp. CAG:770]